MYTQIPALKDRVKAMEVLSGKEQGAEETLRDKKTPKTVLLRRFLSAFKWAGEL